MNQIADLTDQDFELFRKLIYEQSGISLNNSKKELLRTRLRSRLVREGYKSYRDYYRVVKNDDTGKSLIPLLDDISTNLTSFFREMNHFNFLNQHIPAWMEEKKAGGDTTFRIWSAGCSTGEEPYSLVFTLLSHLGDKLNTWKIKILATDLSTEVLARAYDACYPPERLGGISETMKKKYFSVETGSDGRPCFQVIPEIRNLVTFKRLNLMREHFPFKHKFDFIFCRNVMIYFDKVTQEALVNKYYRHIRQGGFLFIGHSESLTGLRHGFKYIQPTIYKV